jgi:EAL domain-containing protein (putative c-di-GMP-specific phosphodiesterase class I)
VGAEALLRWHHPTLGLRAASEFVDTAESSGLMPELGRRVLERSVRQAARWTLPAAFRLRVNASATQLTDAAFADEVRTVLSEAGLPPSRLGIEITETTLLNADDTVTANLEGLRRLGVRIDVDDFGTGYSSLLYLKRLPVDGIKVDRAFVAGLGSDARDEAIVDSIALLAEGLGLDVCGEGVELAAHLDGLRRRGIRSAQGWLFSAAVDASSFAGLLAAGTV